MAQRLLALFLVLAMVAYGAMAQAQGACDLVERETDVENADKALDARLAEYYRTHANVRLGREHRLPNGVAWRLLTDVRTGAVAPRITWMPDRKAMRTANALFESVHGAQIMQYDWTDLYRRRLELYNWDGGPPGLVIGPPYVAQEKFAVTYATSRLVSHVEVTRPIKVGTLYINVTGSVLDIERGTSHSISSCPDPDGRSGYFRFGELLDVCDDKTYKRFMALWSDKVRQAIAKAQIRGDGLSEQCGESMGALDEESRKMELYLTPAGVAVFNEHWWPNMARACALYDDVTVNPIVLSYQELEPFMKPGPWRDDVLKQTPAISRR